LFADCGGDDDAATFIDFGVEEAGIGSWFHNDSN
jgi:hypothetical protein